ncbi:unnamed protein product [Polarella glacialis]|uniref:EF-hand domain-containing protein n=1 Tax=Polarella glacialis TaxID=89957 RepID=A0A813GUR3_POLGL|nr:unnamed protein product [Polarella glacialis]
MYKMRAPALLWLLSQHSCPTMALVPEIGLPSGDRRCLLWNGHGCGSIWDQHSCVRSRDGHPWDMADGRAVHGEPCVWCGGEQCEKNKPFLCAPYGFLKGEAGSQVDTKVAEAVYDIGQCFPGQGINVTTLSVVMVTGSPSRENLRTFVPLNGGEDRACRGKSEADTGFEPAVPWFGQGRAYETWTAKTLEACESLCDFCQAIEYHAEWMECRIWHQPVTHTVNATGYQCYTVTGKLSAEEAFGAAALTAPSEKEMSCLTPWKNGCNSIVNKLTCLSSQDDGPTTTSYGWKVHGQACVWCGNGPCTSNSGSQCQAYDYLLHGEGTAFEVLTGRDQLHVARCSLAQTPHEDLTCLAAASTGCNKIRDSATCLSSKDGRSYASVAGLKVRGEPCVWCGGGPCSTNNPNLCEPHDYAVHGQTHAFRNFLAKSTFKVAVCVNGQATSKDVAREDGVAAAVSEAQEAAITTGITGDNGPAEDLSSDSSKADGATSAGQGGTKNGEGAFPWWAVLLAVIAGLLICAVSIWVACMKLEGGKGERSTRKVEVDKSAQDEDTEMKAPLVGATTEIKAPIVFNSRAVIHTTAPPVRTVMVPPRAVMAPPRTGGAGDLFAQIDGNHNGTIDRREWGAHVRFTAMDRNHDGVIGAEEWRQGPRPDVPSAELFSQPSRNCMQGLVWGRSVLCPSARHTQALKGCSGVDVFERVPTMSGGFQRFHERSALRALLRVCRVADRRPASLLTLLGRPPRRYDAKQGRSVRMQISGSPFVEDAVFDACGGSTEFALPLPGSASRAARRHYSRASALRLPYEAEARDLLRRFEEARNAALEVGIVAETDMPVLTAPTEETARQHSGVDLKNIAAGDFLVTHPLSCLSEPVFDQAVILLDTVEGDQDSDGRIGGIVLNKPTGATLGQMLDRTQDPQDQQWAGELDLKNLLGGVRLMRGGPIMGNSGPYLRQSLRWLHNFPDIAGARLVAPNVWLGGDLAVIAPLAARAEESMAPRVRFFLGSAAWTPLQLAIELECGVWVRAFGPSALEGSDRSLPFMPEQLCFSCPAMSSPTPCAYFKKCCLPAQTLDFFKTFCPSFGQAVRTEAWRAALHAAGQPALATFPRAPGADQRLRGFVERQQRPPSVRKSGKVSGDGDDDKVIEAASAGSSWVGRGRASRRRGEGSE